jgi:hypothetical protein
LEFELKKTTEDKEALQRELGKLKESSRVTNNKNVERNIIRKEQE